MEPGVQSPRRNAHAPHGLLPRYAWLLVQMLRHLGLAARFVSGYLIQLKPDVKSLDGPAAPSHDFTDLHAWAEVYLPGAGWVGPRSNLRPVCRRRPHSAGLRRPMPPSAAPVSGGVEPCEVEFEHEMTVTRIHEDPRVTKPYTDAQWEQIDALGDHDRRRH